MSLIRRILLSSKSSDNGKNIMMTSQSNPEVMRICYWKGWAENPSYMTYEEAASVTNTSAFNSAFNNSDIVYFNEAKYFTGITGTISFTAPRLREFAFLPNASGYDIGAKFPICYRYDIGVCTKLSLRNGVETILNPYIAEILVSPNNTIWAVTNGHLGKGQIIYIKSYGAILWTTPDYKGGVIIYPKKYQQTNRGSVSYSYARYRGHTIVANNFYSGNSSFNNGGYYVQKIISFKNTSYYNNSSFPSNIGSRVPKSVVKEFIVSADDPKDFMADTNYTTNFLNPDVCNFQLRRVNFGITIYNEKALFPLKGLYTDEYFMTKEECTEVTTLGDRFRNSDVEEFTELQYFTSLENIDNAFYGCSKLKTLTLPSHITTIGNNAFANCTSLTNIEIPEGITTIGNNAFANCTSLTNIEIPEGITTIGNNAFANCTSLINIEIPSTVTYIGDNAFSGCVNISTIEMNPTTAPTLGENVWGNNESNYIGSNVSIIKCAFIKNEYIGYDTDKWNVLFEECLFIKLEDTIKAIGSNGSDYLVLDYKPNRNTIIRVEYKHDPFTGKSEPVIDAGDWANATSTTNRFAVIAGGSRDNGGLFIAIGDMIGTGVPMINNNINERTFFNIDVNAFTITTALGTTDLSENLNVTGFTSSDFLHIFKRNDTNKITPNKYIFIYRISVIENNTPIAEYLPFKDDKGNGLINVMNNTKFYGAKGTKFIEEL